MINSKFYFELEGTLDTCPSKPWGAHCLHKISNPAPSASSSYVCNTFFMRSLCIIALILCIGVL